MQSKLTTYELKEYKELDPLGARLSDHLPIIHQNVFFWNIMMKGNIRTNGAGFNNGFGFVEDEKSYIARLDKLAKVIATTLYHNSSIQVIALCEGPNKLKDIQYFFQSLTQYEWMKRFIRDDYFYQPSHNEGQWGLLMLVDNSFKVNTIHHNIDKEIAIKLENRFGLWEFSKDQQEQFFALAHFPFGADEQKNEASDLSFMGKQYCLFVDKLLKKYENKQMIFCADFNFNPYFISNSKDRIFDNIPVNNSLLFFNQNNRQYVTVDGILLSNKEKQRKYSSLIQIGLFKQLKNERDLFVIANKKYIEKNRHVNAVMQEQYDKQFGLTVYKQQ